MVLWLLMVASYLLRSVACNSNRDPRDNWDDFQLSSGFAYSAPQLVLRTLTGVAQLAQCVSQCRAQPACAAVNYETGVCVMFSAPDPGQSVGSLIQSQFPVFTLLAERLASPLGGGGGALPWAYEVVSDHVLGPPQDGRRVQQAVDSQQECMELCLAERRFTCRSASYAPGPGTCALSPYDRFSLPGLDGPRLTPHAGVNYLEANCATTDAARTCDFAQLRGHLLKTVDSVYQEVAGVEACRQLCLREVGFPCRSFDYDAAGARVCRLSHHTAASVQHLQEPYLQLEHVTTYQLATCYNITVECRATAMIAHVRTDALFNGKVYAKDRPHSCVTDVVNSMEFDIRLGYEDRDCGVRQESPGRFASNIILQHHDQIVTSQDVGLAVKCSFSLDQRRVGLGVQLELDPPPPPSHPSPVVTMRITDPHGGDIKSAQVGDSLRLRFHVHSADTMPYQMFVRELIAMDGVDSSEVLLIDSMGCPTDATIMGPITVVHQQQRRDDGGGNGDDSTVLEAPFDAFKFPSSEVVQFKALVTPCAPSCQPVTCHVVADHVGNMRRVESLGRRRRRRRSSATTLVVQSVRVADKSSPTPVTSDGQEKCDGCGR